MSVTIVDYDPGWPARFAERRDLILRAAGQWILFIEHFGSTSVPGLAAKPIIDIVVAVHDVDTDGHAVLDAMKPLGYQFFDAGMPGRLLCTRDADGIDVEHLHIVGTDRWDLMKERLMRDWLLTHPTDRDGYAALKRQIAADTTDGDTYTRAKTAFVQEIVDAARRTRPAQRRRLGGVAQLQDHPRHVSTSTTISGPAGRFDWYCAYFATSWSIGPAIWATSSTTVALPSARTHHSVVQSSSYSSTSSDTLGFAAMLASRRTSLRALGLWSIAR